MCLSAGEGEELDPGRHHRALVSWESNQTAATRRLQSELRSCPEAVVLKTPLRGTNHAEEVLKTSCNGDISPKASWRRIQNSKEGENKTQSEKADSVAFLRGSGRFNMDR